MPKYFDQNKSLTFVGIYLADGKRVFRSSRIKEDAVSRLIGMRGLYSRFINGKYRGQYFRAIIFDNRTKEILEKYDEYGKRIFKQKNQTI